MKTLRLCRSSAAAPFFLVVTATPAAAQQLTFKPPTAQQWPRLKPCNVHCQYDGNGAVGDLLDAALARLPNRDRRAIAATDVSRLAEPGRAPHDCFRMYCYHKLYYLHASRCQGG